MDIELLSRMIGELIVKNDQVGLPGVGTFVAEVVPASFSDKGYTINPPYRRLMFHTDYLGDTVLSDFYSEANNIDKDTARAFITQYLHELKALLLEKKTISLSGLGRLRATKENNIFFIQDEDVDIFPDGFGLEPVSLKSHVEPETVELSVPLSIHEDDSAAPAATVTAEPEITAAPAPEETLPEPEETAAPEPETVPDAAVAITEAEPEAEPVVNETVTRIADEICTNEGADYAAASDVKKVKSRVPWWKVLIVLLLVSALLVGAFMVVARVAPDIVDSFLYTEEELRIINY